MSCSEHQLPVYGPTNGTKQLLGYHMTGIKPTRRPITVLINNGRQWPGYLGTTTETTWSGTLKGAADTSKLVVVDRYDAGGSEILHILQIIPVSFLCFVIILNVSVEAAGSSQDGLASTKTID